MIRIVFLFFVLLFTYSCSLFSVDDKDLLEEQGYSMYQEQDYIDQLVSLAKDYRESKGVISLRMSNANEQYLHEIYNRIVKNNELLLGESHQPKILIIKSEIPFCFSLPRGYFFFSIGLLSKYIKHENLLVAAFAYEIVKSHRKLYEKKIIVPVGYIGIERLLSLVRVPLKVKMEIHKLAFYSMGRAGYDSFSYLIWLQMQNKNALDFRLQLGNTRNISREEFLFKQFMVKEHYEERDNDLFETNSSQGFYRFIGRIRRVRL